MIWRLIEDGAASGSWNMAVDEALLQGQCSGSPPTLRFYHWKPACLSLGRLQRGTFSSPGDLVRRPTGGRAVWHQHEITYAVALRLDQLPRGATSVVAAYNYVSTGLLQGLSLLGVDAALAGQATRAGRAPEKPGANCFDYSTPQCDFTALGRKLIGAAQYRRGDALLQHGSLLLRIDEAAWQQALGTGMGTAISLNQLGLRAPRAQITAALAQGFRCSLGVTLEPGALTSREAELASSLQCNKYATSGWTEGAGSNGPATVCIREHGRV
jgi:lipoate-protein ligase A